MRLFKITTASTFQCGLTDSRHFNVLETSNFTFYFDIKLSVYLTQISLKKRNNFDFHYDKYAWTVRFCADWDLATRREYFPISWCCHGFSLQKVCTWIKAVIKLYRYNLKTFTCFRFNLLFEDELGFKKSYSSFLRMTYKTKNSSKK